MSRTVHTRRTGLLTLTQGHTHTVISILTQARANTHMHTTFWEDSVDCRVYSRSIPPGQLKYSSTHTHWHVFHSLQWDRGNTKRPPRHQQFVPGPCPECYWYTATSHTGERESLCVSLGDYSGNRHVVCTVSPAPAHRLIPWVHGCKHTYTNTHRRRTRTRLKQATVTLACGPGVRTQGCSLFKADSCLWKIIPVL